MIKKIIQYNTILIHVSFRFTGTAAARWPRSAWSPRSTRSTSCRSNTAAHPYQVNTKVKVKVKVKVYFWCQRYSVLYWLLIHTKNTQGQGQRLGHGAKGRPAVGITVAYTYQVQCTPTKNKVKAKVMVKVYLEQKVD